MYHPEVLRDFQNLFEGGDLFARELRAFPFSEIQLAQVVEVHIRDVAVDAGLEVGEVVVGHHEVTVSGDLNVTLVFARRNAVSVFSGARWDAPRWAMIRGRMAWTSLKDKS